MRGDRLLLDTHVFIWWQEDSPRLRNSVRRAIAGATLVHVSVATAWEAAIKASLGKLTLPESIEAGVVASGFEKLPITFAHAEAVARLPLHHRDPFDRLLIAQCLAEDLVFITHDRQIEPYGAEIIWT